MKLLQTLEFHASQILMGVGVFGVSLVLSVLAVAFVILRLGPDHFEATRGPSRFLEGRPTWQRVLGLAGKNLLGFFLVILGVLMALPGVPGQGLLTVFIGVVLLDVPGKRALERRIVAVPAILRACNRLRARFGKAPFTDPCGAEVPARTPRDPGRTDPDRTQAPREPPRAADPPRKANEMRS